LTEALGFGGRRDATRSKKDLILDKTNVNSALFLSVWQRNTAESNLIWMCLHCARIALALALAPAYSVSGFCINNSCRIWLCFSLYVLYIYMCMYMCMYICICICICMHCRCCFNPHAPPRFFACRITNPGPNCLFFPRPPPPGHGSADEVMWLGT